MWQLIWTLSYQILNFTQISGMRIQTDSSALLAWWNHLQWAVLEFQTGPNPELCLRRLGKYFGKVWPHAGPVLMSLCSVQRPLGDSTLGWLDRCLTWQRYLLVSSSYTDPNQCGHSYEHKHCFVGCSLGKIINNNSNKNPRCSWC